MLGGLLQTAMSRVTLLACAFWRVRPLISTQRACVNFPIGFSRESSLASWCWAASGDGKVSLIVRTSDDLLKKIPAGQVIKELAPIVGGKGGGKPDMAEGGGNQPDKLAEALEASYGIVERLLS